MGQDVAEPTRAYQRVYALLKEQIQQGEFPVGSRLPPERLLAARLGVSRNTLRQALRLLREEGLVEPAQGSGVYVRDQGESPPRVKTVAVLLADLLTPLHQHFVHTLTMTGQAKGWVTTIGLHRDSDHEAVSALTRLLHLGPDIVVVEPTRNLTLPLLEHLDSRGTPRIFVIRDHPDLLCDKVVVNNFQVGSVATRLLIQYGCTAPIFVAPLDYLTAWDRLAGYRHALLDAGLPFRPENVLDASRGPLSPPDFGAQLVDGLVAAGSRFDGVVAFNDTFARKIIDGLQQRGLRVPDDVAVVGVDDLPCALEGEVPITTITFDGAGAARQILELIGQRLTVGDRYPTKGTVGLCVVPRASCPVADMAEVAAAASASGPLTERKESPDS